MSSRAAGNCPPSCSRCVRRKNPLDSGLHCDVAMDDKLLPRRRRRRRLRKAMRLWMLNTHRACCLLAAFYRNLTAHCSQQPSAVVRGPSLGPPVRAWPLGPGSGAASLFLLSRCLPPCLCPAVNHGHAFLGVASHTPPRPPAMMPLGRTSAAACLGVHLAGQSAGRLFCLSIFFLSFLVYCFASGLLLCALGMLDAAPSRKLSADRRSIPENARLAPPIYLPSTVALGTPVLPHGSVLLAHSLYDLCPRRPSARPFPSSPPTAPGRASAPTQDIKDTRPCRAS